MASSSYNEGLRVVPTVEIKGTVVLARYITLYRISRY